MTHIEWLSGSAPPRWGFHSIMAYPQTVPGQKSAAPNSGCGQELPRIDPPSTIIGRLVALGRDYNYAYTMVLTSGTKLGPYEIQSPLAAGGMAEVYRARDTRIERIVAIKILPAAFASDADRLLRLGSARSQCAEPSQPSHLIRCRQPRQLGRRVDHHTRDISHDVVRSAIAKLKSAGVADDIFLRPPHEYTSPARADVVRTFGESLPKGLELETTVNCLSSVTALTS